MVEHLYDQINNNYDWFTSRNVIDPHDAITTVNFEYSFKKMISNEKECKWNVIFNNSNDDMFNTTHIWVFCNLK